MKSTKSALLAVALISFGLLAVALYLQHVKTMLPCPLCVEQRYAFTAVGLICLVAAFLQPRGAKVGAALGSIAALVGAGIAIYHLWVQAHPAVTCGIDPLEVALNKIALAKLLPWIFYADGMCTTEYAPILGLSIPQWSLVWFAIFAVMLGRTALRRIR